MPSETDSNENARKFIELGADIVGGITTVALTVMYPDVGAQMAIASGIPLMSEGIRRVGNELVEKILGPREQARVGAVMACIIEKTKENDEVGKHIRTDWNIGNSPGARALGYEIIEGTLLNSQKEYEEKKIRFYGYLAANLGYQANIDRGHANLLLRRAKGMSYRQLCLLSNFAQPECITREADYLNEKMDTGLEALLLEIRELNDNFLINIGFSPSSIIQNIQPRLIKATEIGREIYSLMELSKIDSTDFLETIRLMR